MQDLSSDILLHCCCAPCSLHPTEIFQKEKRRITLYWYNHNIQPLNEYIARFKTLEKFSRDENIPLIVTHKYNVHEFLEFRKLEAQPPTRCYNCYYQRLENSFQTARKLSIPAVSTTLLVSPYQDHDYIKRTGNELSSRYHIEFIYRDFRPGFRTAQQIARTRNYYMQSYCGCILSEYDRYQKKYKKLMDSS